MNSRKLATALTTAGLATVALSGVTHDAAAVPRTFQVTLVTGATITVTLDLPPGVMPSSIPGVSVGIVSITEVGAAPAAPPVQVDPGLPQGQAPAPAPAQEQQQQQPSAAEQTGQTPSPASADDAEAARGSSQPKQDADGGGGGEPQAKPGGGIPQSGHAQETTGSALRDVVEGVAGGGKRGGSGSGADGGTGPAAAGTAMRQPDGTSHGLAGVTGQDCTHR